MDGTMVKTKKKENGEPLLPYELLGEIFSQLPFSTIMKLSSISKGVHSMFSDSFLWISKLVRNNEPCQALFLLDSYADQIRLSIKSSIMNTKAPSFVVLPHYTAKRKFFHLSFCNGMVLSCNRDTGIMYLSNPLYVDEVHAIPASGSNGEANKALIVLCGFGFNCSNRKFVVMCLKDVGSEFLVVETHVVGRTSLWNQYKGRVSKRSKGPKGHALAVFYMGAFYWFVVNAKNEIEKIQLFCLDTKRTNDVLLPLSLARRLLYFGASLGDIKGDLMFGANLGVCLELHKRTKFGWEWICTIRTQFCATSFLFPLGFIEGGILVDHQSGENPREIILYDPCSDASKTLAIHLQLTSQIFASPLTRLRVKDVVFLTP